jgi:hypothetical protein
MRKIFMLVALTVAGSIIAATNAHAFLNQPTKGKNFKVNLMTAYEPCTVPNAMTDDGFDACTPPVRSNPTCGFDGGLGKVQLKSLTVGNAAFRIKVTGLDNTCEGETVNFFITFRKTGVHCGLAECTMVTVVGQPLGSCSVQNSLCSTAGSLFLPGGADQGQVEILEVYAEVNGARTFNMGLITKRP